MDSKTRHRFEEILERVPEGANRILDIGCVRHSSERRQQGSLHDYIVNNTSADVVGTDVEEDGIQEMRAAGYNVHKGDAHALSNATDGTFDAIVAGEVIEHLHSPGQFLSGVQEVLAPDGVLILTTPNPDAFVFFRKALSGESNNPTHTCWIDPTQLAHLCEVTKASIELQETEWLPPSGGLSQLLWKLGKRRASSPTYLATIGRLESN